MKHSATRRGTPWLLVATFVGLAAVIAGVGYWVWRDSTASLRRDAEQSLKAVGDLKADEITAWLAERRADAEALSGNRLLAAAVQKAAAGQAGTKADRRVEGLITATRRSHGYVDVVVVDTAVAILYRVPAGASHPLGERVPKLIAQAIAGQRVTSSDLYLNADGDGQIDFVAPLLVGVAGGEGRPRLRAGL
jgi:hypothetical protein